MNKQKFTDWVEYVQDKHDEYAYRYFYDAYLTVKSNDRSFYYCLTPEPTRHQLMDTMYKQIELTFDSPEEKQEFMDFMFDCFCKGYSSSMEEWHAKRMGWHGDDMNNWE